jgi:hypothetical protein
MGDKKLKLEKTEKYSDNFIKAPKDFVEEALNDGYNKACRQCNKGEDLEHSLFDEVLKRILTEDFRVPDMNPTSFGHDFLDAEKGYLEDLIYENETEEECIERLSPLIVTKVNGKTAILVDFNREWYDPFL